MGFLSGSVTFERFRITEDPTNSFCDDHLETLQKHRIGKSSGNLHEQPTIGFTGGAHILDTDFNIEKNILGESMHFGIRIDSCSIPGPIKRAWMQMELAAVMSENMGARPTKTQRQEAQEAVDQRCADEAQKGNFKRMAETAVLWDAATDTVFLGGSSEKTNDACIDLLERAFGLEFKRISSGQLALEYADETEQNAQIFAVEPTAFLPDVAPGVIWWNGMTDNYDYLGNEFLLWLWWKWESHSDTIELADGSTVSGMFARSLSLDCPQGESGKETISAESPVALPEAAMAIRNGKLPRKAGLTIVRNGEQYDFTLQAETFVLGSTKISQPEGSAADTGGHLERIASLHRATETLDLLFHVFCATRFAKSWSTEAQQVSRWLQAEKPLRKQRTAA